MPSLPLLFSFIASSLFGGIFFWMKKYKSEAISRKPKLFFFIYAIIAFTLFYVAASSVWGRSETILESILYILTAWFLVVPVIYIQDDYVPYSNVSENIMGIFSLAALIGTIIGFYNIYHKLATTVTVRWQLELVHLAPQVGIIFIVLFISLTFEQDSVLQIIGFLAVIVLLLIFAGSFFKLTYLYISFTVTGIAVVLLIGYLLFLLKKGNRKLYGIIEIGFSVYTAFSTLQNQLNTEGHSFSQLVQDVGSGKLSALSYFQLFGAIYIFIRGLDNINEYKKLNDRSVLFLSALKNDLDKAEILYLIGVNKKYRDSNGDSYFHHAVREQNKSAVMFLKDRKFPWKKKNKSRKTPASLATELGYAEIAQLFNQKN